MAADFLQTARFFRRFRYLGMVLFGWAALVSLGVIGLVVMGELPLRNLLLCVFATGTALGAFGTSNDTALHAMVQVEGRLGADEAAELAHERRTRPLRLHSAHASPKMAYALPIVSLLASGLLASRVYSLFEPGVAAGFFLMAPGSAA